MAAPIFNDAHVLVGMKVMFHYRGGWFVGEVLRHDKERERYLIDRQQRRDDPARVWIDEDLVHPLPGSTPKSGFLGPDG
jgi:hypothetical protein